MERRDGGGSNYITSLAGGTQSVFCSDNLEEEKIRGRFEGETRTHNTPTTKSSCQVWSSVEDGL